MARTSSVLKILALGVLAHISLAQAQQKPSSAPPKLERIEEGSDTPITVTPQTRNQKQIIETRENGQVSEVTVKSGKSTYTMKGKPPDSVSQLPENTFDTLRPPQWKVMEFDIGKKKQKEREEAGDAAAPPAAAPPPPPPAK